MRLKLADAAQPARVRRTTVHFVVKGHLGCVTAMLLQFFLLFALKWPLQYSLQTGSMADVSLVFV